MSSKYNNHARPILLQYGDTVTFTLHGTDYEYRVIEADYWWLDCMHSRGSNDALFQALEIDEAYKYAIASAYHEHEVNTGDWPNANTSEALTRLVNRMLDLVWAIGEEDAHYEAVAENIAELASVNQIFQYTLY